MINVLLLTFIVMLLSDTTVVFVETVVPADVVEVTDPVPPVLKFMIVANPPLLLNVSVPPAAGVISMLPVFVAKVSDPPEADCITRSPDAETRLRVLDALALVTVVPKLGMLIVLDVIVTVLATVPPGL